MTEEERFYRMPEHRPMPTRRKIERATTKRFALENFDLSKPDFYDLWANMLEAGCILTRSKWNQLYAENTLSGLTALVVPTGLRPIGEMSAAEIEISVQRLRESAALLRDTGASSRSEAMRRAKADDA